jgi:hypothetical protein
MHTIFLCNFSKYAYCDSPNTPFLLSRWISILIIESHSLRIYFWTLRTRTSSSFTIDWHYCYHARCQSHMHDYEMNFPFYNVVQMLSSYSLLNPKINNQVLYLWMLSFVNDFLVTIPFLLLLTWQNP